MTLVRVLILAAAWVSVAAMGCAKGATRKERGDRDVIIDMREMKCPVCGSRADYIAKGEGVVMCVRRMECLWNIALGRAPETVIKNRWVAAGLPLMSEDADE